ncbi:uncharacterized protein PGTG_13820 [Puccinia graminis f. sp. tritici CRL 75-36-700-3]|uniref:SWIM-type domain-containing protein n=1 Tax=Puccinia graminis f. sp. tritici (strain CRL 75-36-700-3 / race SCCL) TaxID=418459 RepID=E3KUR6_PUCGT|nr:uncharacterized protein PGTG_13820 [Puccinia graminis f. sp. tritici CRL 75-36-700-3]EFP88016.2 hypothetical protein PGTG_13820 [Puccinia graminis f. sp. tritici CRL 75-36-700-3]
MVTFLEKWNNIHPKFANYVNGQWNKHILHWAVFFANCFSKQTAHQGIHTNNYTEAWHRVLKARYLTKDKCRIDEVIQILADEVATDYRFNCKQVNMGFAPQTTNKFQMRSKILADSYTKESLLLLGVGQFQHDLHFFTSSFTNPIDQAYTVHFELGRPGHMPRLRKCTCAHFLQFASACKHMYYFAREHQMLVIEQVDPSEWHNPTTWAPEPSQRRELILIDDVDSDIKIVNPKTSSKQMRGKENHNSAADTSTKRTRVHIPCSGTLSDSLTLAMLQPTHSTMLTSTQSNKEVAMVDNNILNARAQSSGLNTLKWVVEVLKTVKNRKDFAQC